MKIFFLALMTLGLGAQASLASTPPFRSGQVDNIAWEVRFNHLDPNGPTLICNLKGQKAGAHCEGTETREAARLSGTEDRLIEIMNLPEIKSVALAYYSFSNTRIRRALCESAKSKNLKVRVYIDSSPANIESVRDLAECSPNVVIQPVGLGFGRYIQHMKIFLASELEDPVPLSELSGAQAFNAGKSKAFVVSSSGNMSGYGTSLHFDNWLIFETTFAENIIQQNLCALRSMDGQSVTQDTRKDFAIAYSRCRARIFDSERSDLQFFAVPHGHKSPEPYNAYSLMLSKAQSEVMVAIHRLTTPQMYRPWLQAFQRGLPVSVIMDDDTLRRGKVNGQPYQDVQMEDVRSERALRKAGITVTYMETGAASRPHLFHSKFVVVDPGKPTGALFQGAGNFTSTAMNIDANGNFEQYYVIKVPEIVQAYAEGWNYYRELSTRLEDHPVAKQKDL